MVQCAEAGRSKALGASPKPTTQTTGVAKPGLTLKARSSISRSQRDATPDTQQATSIAAASSGSSRRDMLLTGVADNPRARSFAVC